MRKREVSQFDAAIKKLVKEWMFLRSRASPEIVYLAISKVQMIDVSTIIQGLKMMTAADSTVRRIAVSQLDAVIKRKIGRLPSNEDRSRYLNGSLENEFGRDGRDRFIMDPHKECSQEAEKQDQNRSAKTTLKSSLPSQTREKR